MPPNILALTEPSKPTSKTLLQLETEEDEQQFIVEAAGIMQKDRQNFARLRKHLLHDYTPKQWWKFWARREGD